VQGHGRCPVYDYYLQSIHSFVVVCSGSLLRYEVDVHVTRQRRSPMRHAYRECDIFSVFTTNATYDKLTEFTKTAAHMIIFFSCKSESKMDF
jgi:hypothetical protein